MSAECEKCGLDLVYPEGTWPIGECPGCSRDERIAALESELAEARGEIEKLQKALDRSRFGNEHNAPRCEECLGAGYVLFSVSGDTP